MGPTNAIIKEQELVKVIKAKPLGAGAFGSVVLCEYNGMQVAVKRMNPGAANSRTDIESFVRECRILSGIQHPAIAALVGCGFPMDLRLGVNAPDVCIDQASLFAVQELCDGGNLRTLVEKQMTAFSRKLRDYSAADALEWCIDIAQALDYLHTHSPPILHRDIKLDNLMLTTGGKDMRPGIKLVDFGLAKPLVGASLSDPQPGSAPKGNGTQLTEQTGSWSYMAPEVYKGEPYGGRADVFALGVIVFELFHGITLATLIVNTGSPIEFRNYAKRVAEEGHRKTIGNYLPPELTAAIEKFWAQDAEDRPNAAEAVKILISLRDVVEAWQPAAGAQRSTPGQKLKNMLSKFGSSNGRPSTHQGSSRPDVDPSLGQLDRKSMA